jgi:hypothetical protein
MSKAWIATRRGSDGLRPYPVCVQVEHDFRHDTQNGPFVHRLGRLILSQERGVQLSYGLRLDKPKEPDKVVKYNNFITPSRGINRGDTGKGWPTASRLARGYRDTVTR